MWQRNRKLSMFIFDAKIIVKLIYLDRFDSKFSHLSRGVITFDWSKGWFKARQVEGVPGATKGGE